MQRHLTWSDLPPEIRNMIYEAAYVESSDFKIISTEKWRENELQRRRFARARKVSYEVCLSNMIGHIASC